MVTGRPNLERECEGHDDIGNHNILEVYNKVRLGGDAKKHPHSHTIKGEPQQEEKGVENRKNHCLQHVVTGAGAVSGAMIASEQGEGCISLHERCLKITRESSCQYVLKITQKTNKQK